MKAFAAEIERLAALYASLGHEGFQGRLDLEAAKDNRKHCLEAFGAKLHEEAHKRVSELLAD